MTFGNKKVDEITFCKTQDQITTPEGEILNNQYSSKSSRRVSRNSNNHELVESVNNDGQNGDEVEPKIVESTSSN